MHAVCTKAPCLPNDRPAQRPTTIPVHFPIKALKLMKLWRCTPANTPFISGTPEPSASLLMYSLHDIMKISNYSIPNRSAIHHANEMKADPANVAQPEVPLNILRPSRLTYISTSSESK